MLTKLVVKDFKMYFPKLTFLFFLLGALMLVPSYPSAVTMIYSFFILQISLTLGLSNRDLEFTALLPATRKQIVLSRIISTIVIELLYIIATIPFAIISSLIIQPSGNPIGIDKNIAFYGYTLIAYAVMNLFLFTLYYKNCNKIGLALCSGIAAFLVVVILFEVIIALVPPINAALDTLSTSGLIPQLIFLVCCIAVSCVLTFLTYKLSVKQFEKMVI